MAILLKKVEKSVLDLIYDKQRDLTKEKGKKISLERTVETLLKDAYLRKNG